MFHLFKKHKSKTTLNKNLGALLSISGVFVFGASLLGPLYAIYVKQIGGNVLTIGWTYSVYMFTVGIAAFFADKYGDKIKEAVYVPAVGYDIWAVGFLGYTAYYNRKPDAV